MGRVVKIKSLCDADVLDNEEASEMLNEAIAAFPTWGQQQDGGGASNGESDFILVEDGDAGASATRHRDAGTSVKPRTSAAGHDADSAKPRSARSLDLRATAGGAAAVTSAGGAAGGATAVGAAGAKSAGGAAAAKSSMGTIYGSWGLKACSTPVRGEDGKKALDAQGNILKSSNSVISPPKAAGNNKEHWCPGKEFGCERGGFANEGGVQRHAPVCPAWQGELRRRRGEKDPWAGMTNVKALVTSQMQSPVHPKPST